MGEFLPVYELIVTRHRRTPRTEGALLEVLKKGCDWDERLSCDHRHRRGNSTARKRSRIAAGDRRREAGIAGRRRCEHVPLASRSGCTGPLRVVRTVCRSGGARFTCRLAPFHQSARRLRRAGSRRQAEDHAASTVDGIAGISGAVVPGIGRQATARSVVSTDNETALSCIVAYGIGFVRIIPPLGGSRSPLLPWPKRQSHEETSFSKNRGSVWEGPPLAIVLYARFSVQRNRGHRRHG